MIYNMMGEVVATLVDEEKQAGRYNAAWEVVRLASGVNLKPFPMTAHHSGRAYGSRITRSLRYIGSERTGFRDDEGALRDTSGVKLPRSSEEFLY